MAALPATVYVPVGSEFEQGRPLGSRVRFNGEGGIRKEWWWQTGPVDSCCCCCSLSTGVGVLAVMGFLSGVYALFTLSATVGTPLYEQQVAETEKMYADSCQDVDEPSPMCGVLATQTLNFVLVDELYTPLIVQACIGTLASMIGMWAVATHNVLGAKLFMWACLLSYSTGLVIKVLIAMRRNKFWQHYDVGFYRYWMMLSDVIDSISCVYYLKVMWSYYVTLKRKTRAAASASESAGNIELDGSTTVV